jgi:hypothetical protein
MASIFDFPEVTPETSSPLDSPPSKASKGRRGRLLLTAADLAEGKKVLAGMINGAMIRLHEIIEQGDDQTAIKAIQILLDRSGFGPKSSLDVTTTSVDLSSLSRAELADRASAIERRLRATGTDGPIIEKPTVN